MCFKHNSALQKNKAAQRLALPAAGEKKDRKRETAKAQTKAPKNAQSPSRPVHAVLGVSTGDEPNETN